MRHTSCHINGYIRLQVVDLIRRELMAADPQYVDDFSRSCFGHLLRPVWDQSQCCNAGLHALFCNEILRDGTDDDTFIFRVGDREITFSRSEFALVTGLRFGPSDFDIHVDELPPDGTVFWRYGAIIHQPMDRIRDAFVQGTFRDQPGDTLKVAKALAAAYLVIGWDGQKKVIDYWIWRLVEDADGWDSFPWGLYAWQILAHYIGAIPIDPPPPDRKGRVQYHVYGNYYALMVCDR